MKNFDPCSPAMPFLNPQGNQAHLTSKTQDTGIFPPHPFTTPQPIIFGAPMHNPFYNDSYNQYQQPHGHTKQPYQLLQGQIQNP